MMYAYFLNQLELCNSEEAKMLALIIRRYWNDRVEYRNGSFYLSTYANFRDYSSISSLGYTDEYQKIKGFMEEVEYHKEHKIKGTPICWRVSSYYHNELQFWLE